MNRRYDYDLFVIGAGSGGVAASRRAAAHGAKAGIAEDSRVGGTCVIRGCVPKKLLAYAAHYADDFEDAAAYGWMVGQRSFDWTKLVANKDKEIDRLNGIYIRMLKNAGVTLHEARAAMVDPHTVEVGGKRITAETVLIATGGRPVKPGIPGADLAITSNEAFHLPSLPKRVVMVGGGYIAVEFAGIFNGVGADVVQLYRGEQILRGFDRDIRDTLAEEVRKAGIDLRVKTDVSEIEKRGGALVATLTTGGTIEADCIMMATGRKPNSSGLGLEALGVGIDAEGAVKVDDWSRTVLDNVYAIGDVTNRMNLTPIAINEGRAFADTLYGKKPRKLDYANVPSAVFSRPTVGTVGLSEDAARARYGEIDIYKATFRPMKHTLTGRDEKTMMKLVVDARTDKVLGAHMVGADAPEIIQGIAIGLICGATKAQFDATVAIHPSAAEEFVTMRDKWVPPAAKAAE